MGGAVSHGYAVKDRKLVVVPAEAANVWLIFERYLALGSVLVLTDDLEQRGLVTRERVDRNGVARGGEPFTRNALYKMLRNRLYLGEMPHKDISYPGEHDAIVDQELFDRVQALMDRNRIEHAYGVHASEPGLLIGKVWDSFGRRMSPAHSCKRERRYCYYQSDVRDSRVKERAQRVPAGELEAMVIAQLRQRMDVEGAPTALLTLETASFGEQRRLVAELVERIDIHADRAEIGFAEAAGEPQRVTIEAELIRRGKETRFALPPDERVIGSRDPALIKLVAKAHVAREALASAREQTVEEVVEALTGSRRRLGDGEHGERQRGATRDGQDSASLQGDLSVTRTTASRCEDCPRRQRGKHDEHREAGLRIGCERLRGACDDVPRQLVRRVLGGTLRPLHCTVRTKHEVLNNPWGKSEHRTGEGDHRVPWPACDIEGAERSRERRCEIRAPGRQAARASQ